MRFNERESRVCSSQPHAVSRQKPRNHTAIHDTGRACIWAGHDELKLPRGGIHDRAVGKRVGVERRKDKGVEILSHDRPTGRKIVGR